jgi:hypothetical protein
LTAFDTFDVTVMNVNDAPVLVNPLADQTASAGSAFSLVVPLNAFTDVDAGDMLSYSAARANGTSLPSWLTFNAATRTLAGTPSAAGHRHVESQDYRY